jgi:hypothetical protein
LLLVTPFGALLAIAAALATPLAPAVSPLLAAALLLPVTVVLASFVRCGLGPVVAGAPAPLAYLLLMDGLVGRRWTRLPLAMPRGPATLLATALRPLLRLLPPTLALLAATLALLATALPLLRIPLVAPAPGRLLRSLAFLRLLPVSLGALARWPPTPPAGPRPLLAPLLVVAALGILAAAFILRVLVQRSVLLAMMPAGRGFPVLAGHAWCR